MVRPRIECDCIGRTTNAIGYATKVLVPLNGADQPTNELHFRGLREPTRLKKHGRNKYIYDPVHWISEYTPLALRESQVCSRWFTPNPSPIIKYCDVRRLSFRSETHLWRPRDYTGGLGRDVGFILGHVHLSWISALHPIHVAQDNVWTAPLPTGGAAAGTNEKVPQTDVGLDGRTRPSPRRLRGEPGVCKGGEDRQVDELWAHTLHNFCSLSLDPWIPTPNSLHNSEICNAAAWSTSGLFKLWELFVTAKLKLNQKYCNLTNAIKLTNFRKAKQSDAVTKMARTQGKAHTCFICHEDKSETPSLQDIGTQSDIPICISSVNLFNIITNRGVSSIYGSALGTVLDRNLAIAGDLTSLSTPPPPVTPPSSPQCCSSVISSDNFAASLVAAVLGLNLTGIDVPVGPSCSPIIIVSSNSLRSDPL
ncbi:hypothetical protein B0H17DRAFT_1133630 [Mycena rosella]|uniref:Uncharacterized protein n=1 Tax=Mycena rosella TaxID=1033263 RepID=A0AAD7DJA5_MYCRO|nr:hypothetical protein B0H17DRAFT_1133630 [Mycena rosella]